MAFDKTTLGLYHTFSKTPVDQNSGSAAAQLGNAINKSGHTVQSSEVWAEAIPFYGKAGKTDLAHKNLSATANTNDLVQVGDVLYQRNSTPAVFNASGVLTSTFNDLWFVKTTSIISTTKGENGEYPTVDGALVDGSYLVNAEGKPVIRYYKDRLLTPLIDDNNANTHSQGWASRLKVDGRWVEQFVGATDAYVNGNAAVMYSPVVYRKKGDAKPLDAGAGKHYMDYCATGIILWDSQKTNITTNSAGEFTGATEVISCFEYIGDKLDASLNNIRKDVQDIIGTTMEGVVASVDADDAAQKAGISIIDTNDTGAGSKTSPQIAFAEGSITDTETKLVSGKTVKEYVDTVSTEQKIWNLNQFFNENCTRDDIPWIREVLEYKEVGGMQLVYFQQADKYTTNEVLDTSNKTTGEDAVTRHKAVANAWINYVKENGHAPYELVFKKDSFYNNEIIRHMFAQLDKDAGVEYLSEGSISKRCMKPGLSVKYVTVLNTSESYDPFGSHIDLDLGIVDDKDTDSQKFYPSFTTSTWHGKTRFNSGDSILDRNTPASINAAGANSFLNATNDSFMRAYNWTYTVNEQEHKFVVDAIKSGGSISKAIDEAVKITEIKVNGTTVTPTNKVADITAIEGVTTTAVNGVSLAKDGNNVKVAVTPASYTKSTTTGSLGTWDNQKLSNLATAQSVSDAVADVKAYADSLHTTSLDYIVLGDSESLPTASAETLGKIYLVASQNAPTADGSAISGSYVEYMTRKVSDTQYTWEKIGTTEADLSAYAKTADLNATNVGSGAVKVTQTNGKVSSVTVDTEALVSNGAIKTSVTDANALVKAGDALEAIKLAKPENYVESVTGYTDKGAEVTTTQGAEIKVLDSRGTSVTPDDLWGTKVTLDASGNITVTDNYIANWTKKSPDYEFGWCGDNTITTVENNKIYADGAFKANIQTDKIKAGYNMFANSSLTSFNGDLSNLIDGSYMFSFCKNLTSFDSDLTNLTDAANMFEETSALTSFGSDLSSLRSGYNMFASSSLTSFNSDLSSLIQGFRTFYNTSLTSFNSSLSNLIKGEEMFYNCKKLISFNGDLNNLVDGTYMFKGTGLTSFDSDLYSLTNGYHMFASSSLTSFNSDLSNLVSGYSMFHSSGLTSFNGDLNNLVNGQEMFWAAPLTSFNGDLSSLVVGYSMFYGSSLTSFNGDLSSLVVGAGMFENTSLNIDSVETICDVLPNWKENKLMTNSYDEATNKITPIEWGGSQFCYYIRSASGVICSSSMAPEYVKTITIKWKKISDLTEAEKQKVLDLMVNTANEKGWTFITNTEIDSDGKVSPTQIMATDGTVQRYTYVTKIEADEKTAKFVDADGEYWNVDTAECIIGPNVKYWELFATKEDAITAWGLSEYTYVEPTEEA